jgi:predicted nucleic acid-binding Zn ribbon protein
MPDGRRPEPVGEAVRRFLREHGLARRVEQVSALDAWPRAVGPAVAAATRALSVAADGTLLVGVRSSAWMNELTLMERELIAALNREIPSAGIARIRWQLVP